MCSSVSGPVHPVHHRVAPGPDILLFTRDTAGLAGGDDCRTEIQVGDGASIIISDPGPTNLFPSCDGRSGYQAIELSVAPCARAVLLPHAVVPFSGSRTVTTTRVQVAPSATAVVGGVLSPGRVASGERWAAELYQQRLEMRRGREILASDALRVPWPAGSLGCTPQRSSGPNVIGHLVSLLAYRTGVAAELDRVRLVAGCGPGVSAVTDDLLVLRAIVDSCAAGYTLLRKVVTAVLPDLETWPWSRIGYAGAGLG
jgi:urease accessory protein